MGKVLILGASGLVGRALINEFRDTLLQYRLFLEKDDTCYFALKSNRLDIPSSLQYTNNDIISLLIKE
jgi:nucleoside-diphosphate-sugar epimerase